MLKKSADTLAAMVPVWRRGPIYSTDTERLFNDCGHKAEKLYETFERADKYVDRMHEKYMKLWANKKHKKRTANKKHNK